MAPGRMRVEIADPPSAAQGWAVVRVEAVGLCGSDYHLFDGTHPYAHFPQVQGHEMVGRVESLNGASPVEVGARVVIEPLLRCGVCFACRRGRYNCCSRLQVIGVHRPGGLADLVTVPVGQLYAVGELPPLLAVLVEPMSIGLNSIDRGQVGPGDTVLVIGAGPIGLLAARAAIDHGAEVLVADRSASRLERAQALGVARTVDTTARDLARSVANFTSGEGAAVIIEATGSPGLLREAVDLVAPSGAIVVVGISTENFTVPVSEFSRKEIAVLGARNSAGIFRQAADLVARESGSLTSLVTHTFPLTEAGEAMAFARANPDLVGKVVITIDDSVSSTLSSMNGAARSGGPSVGQPLPNR